MITTEHALRGPFRLLERCHGFAKIVERGPGVRAERVRVNPPHPEREIIILTKNASRHGHRLAQQRLGFFETLQNDKGISAVVGCYEAVRRSAIVFLVKPNTQPQAAVRQPQALLVTAI